MDGEGQNGFDAGTMIAEDGSFTPEFHAQVPGILGDEFKDFKGFEKYKTFGDFLKGAAHAQRQVGQKTEGMVKVPGEKATPEEIAAFRAAVGVPESADKYDTGRDPAKQYDKEGEAAFRKFAHEQGIGGKQFTALMKFFDAYEDGLMAKAAEQEKKAGEAATTEFNQKHGAQAETVKRQAGDAMVKLGFDKVIDKFEGLKNDPGLIDWFHEQAKKMLPGDFHEASSPPPSSGGLAAVYDHPTSKRDLG